MSDSKSDEKKRAEKAEKQRKYSKDNREKENARLQLWRKKNQVYIVENIHPTQSFILGVFSDYSHGKKLMDKIFIEELKHSNEEVFDINTHKPTKNEIKQAKKEFEWYSSDRNISFISPSEPDRYYTLTPVKVLDDLTHSEGYDKELFDSGILDFDQYSFKENYPFKDAESFEVTIHERY